jgi:hypothetical protein
MPPASLPEERFRRRYIARATEMRFYGSAEFINGAVQIHPFPRLIKNTKPIEITGVFYDESSA